MGMDLCIIPVDEESGAVWKASTYISLPRNYDLLAKYDWQGTVFSKKDRRADGLPDASVTGGILPQGVAVEFLGELADDFWPGKRTDDPYGDRLTFLSAGAVLQVLREGLTSLRNPMTIERREAALAKLRTLPEDQRVVLLWC